LKIFIEFTGVAREFTGTGEMEVEVPAGSTYRDLVRLLADLFPGLVGVLIDPNRESFLSSNMFVINGDLAFPAMIMDESPVDGERIALMSVITGG